MFKKKLTVKDIIKKPSDRVNRVTHDTAVKAMEREMLVAFMEGCDGDIDKVAKCLSMTKRQLYGELYKYGLIGQHD